MIRRASHADRGCSCSHYRAYLLWLRARYARRYRPRPAPRAARFLTLAEVAAAARGVQPLT